MLPTCSLTKACKKVWRHGVICAAVMFRCIASTATHIAKDLADKCIQFVKLGKRCLGQAINHQNIGEVLCKYVKVHR